MIFKMTAEKGGEPWFWSDPSWVVESAREPRYFRLQPPAEPSPNPLKHGATWNLGEGSTSGLGKSAPMFNRPKHRSQSGASMICTG